MATAADYNTVVQALYVAYFGRPADPIGLANLTAALASAGVPSTVDGLQAAYGSNATVKFYVDAFGTSAESEALYNGASTAQFVSDIFLNVLGRPIGNTAAELQGLLFWVNAIDTGVLSKGDAALSIMQGALHNTTAQGLIDAQTVANKLAVAANFTTNIDTASELIAYDGAAAAQTARTMLNQVTSTTNVTTFQASVTSTLAALVTAYDTTFNTGVSSALTTGVDTVNLAASTKIDTVNGILGGGATVNTLTAGDSITGNDKTLVKLTAAVTGTAISVPVTTISHVAAVDFAGVSDTINVNALNWTNVGGVELIGGTGMQVNVSNMAGGALAGMAANTTGTVDVTGTLSSRVNYEAEVYGSPTTHSTVSVFASGVNVAVGDGGDGYASVTSSAPATGHTNITLGDINATLGKGAYFSADFSADGSLTTGNLNLTLGASASIDDFYLYSEHGSVTVGNINVTNGASADVWMKIDAGFSTTKTADVTVGAITVSQAGSGDFTLDIYNDNGNVKDVTTVGDITITGKTGDFSEVYMDTTGNVTVGKVSISNGGTAEFYDYGHNGNMVVGDITLASSATASSSGSVSFSVDNYGGKSAANTVTVGNISETIGDHATGYGYVYNYDNTANANGTGALTVGNITVHEGAHSTYTFSASNDVWNVVTGGDAGSITIGNITVTAGIASTVNLNVTHENDAGGGDVASTTLGNVTVTGDDGLSFNMDVYVSNDTGGTVGDIKVGNVNVTGGVSADAYFTVEAQAYTGDTGGVTVGNVNMTVGDKGDAYFYVTNTASASVGDLKIGDVTLAAGKSGEAGFSAELNGKAGDTGAFTVGNISLTGGQSAEMWAEMSDYAQSGDAGAVTIGNLSATMGKAAYAEDFIYMDVTATHDIGAFKAGNVTFSMAQSATVTDFYYGAYAGDKLASYTVGNVSVTTAKSASFQGYLTASADQGITGAVSVGNVTMNAAAQSTIDLDITVKSSAGNVGTTTIGNVNLTSAVGDTQAHSANATLTVTVEATAGTDGLTTVGNITLAAGYAHNTGTGDIFSNSQVTVTAKGAITVGNITISGGGHDYVTLDSTGNKAITVGDIKVSNTAADHIYDHLTDFLTLTTTGTITVGNIDYSGYNHAAVIDVSGYKGAGTITGTTNADTITVDAGTHVITGHGGADTFVFGANSTNKTAATVDQITDWTSSDHMTLTGVTYNVNDYDEITVSSGAFADFLTAASAGIAGNSDNIVVGKVGGNLFVAVHLDADVTAGKIDYVLELTGVNDLTKIDFGNFV